MHLRDLNWMDVEHYLEHDTRVILVTGATEQHAYLSLLTDVLIPEKIALAAAERASVLVAPSINFGVREEMHEFPGTVSISQTVFDLLLGEVVEGLLHQGFNRFMIINGHSGNKLPARVRELQMDGMLRVVWYDWWNGQAIQTIETEVGLKFDHANWAENFPFTRVTEVPEEEKEPALLSYISAGQTAREVLGDGSFGGPYQVRASVTDALFMRTVDEAVELLNTL